MYSRIQQTLGRITKVLDCYICCHKSVCQKLFWRLCRHVTACHRLVTNRFLIIHFTKCFKEKLCNVHYCTFLCFYRFHFVRKYNIKACVGCKDPRKDFVWKGNFFPRILVSRNSWRQEYDSWNSFILHWRWQLGNNYFWWKTQKSLFSTYVQF